MTDNRMNEPTPEQVEAAAKAIYSVQRPGGAWYENQQPRWHRKLARAALEAAARATQGAAPQAESADCDRDRMGICKRCGMGLDARKILDGDFACPVLPSSGVDDEKLAEVIGKARTTSVRDDDGVKSIVMESNEQIARAVAEWLKGQGR